VKEEGDREGEEGGFYKLRRMKLLLRTTGRLDGFTAKNDQRTIKSVHRRAKRLKMGPESTFLMSEEQRGATEFTTVNAQKIN
jgi:hypothetical protein